VRLALKIAAIVVGAAVAAIFTVFATTFGDCGPNVTLAACE